MILGILSLVLSVISLFVFWWLGIVGAILGIIGYSNSNKESAQGSTTTANKVLCGLGVGIGVVSVADGLLMISMLV